MLLLLVPLEFDDFISELIKITNGIGQGNPISLLLYILYNADLLYQSRGERNFNLIYQVDFFCKATIAGLTN